MSRMHRAYKAVTTWLGNTNKLGTKTGRKHIRKNCQT